VCTCECVFVKEKDGVKECVYMCTCECVFVKEKDGVKECVYMYMCQSMCVCERSRRLYLMNSLSIHT